MPGNPNNDGPGKDGLEDWLDQRITPLPPPDGTFGLIKRRARNRKLRKLAVTVSAAAAVVAAIVTVPRVTLLHITNPSKGIAVGNGAATHPSISYSPQEDGNGTPAPSPTPSTTGNPLPPVPPNFSPYSVTFVGLHTGWVVGQAGTPGHCATSYCTSIARTDDDGQSWHGVPAPVTGTPSGATGVSQIRFLNDQDGWVFGPELWATHDGGQTWTQLSTDGKRVVGLATAGTRAFGIFATCSGTGTDFAADCTSFTLMSAPAGSDNWSPVGSATTKLSGSAAAAQLALTSSRGYLLAPDGTLYSGALGGAWSRIGKAPCAPETNLFGAINSTTLMLVCPGNHTVYNTSDDGTTWQKVATYPASLQVSSATVSPVGGYVLATTTSLYYLHGSTWQPATLRGAASPDGYSFVGMTTPTQGIALSGAGSTHYVWVTRDGGMTWQALPVSS